MSKRKRIAIIGHFAEGADFKDGQTVKTRILFDELEALGKFDILKVDTYLKREKPLLLLIKSVWALIARRDVIVLLSQNGMHFYFPILRIFAKLRGTRVYHDVIGGNLDSHASENPKFADCLRAFRVNWVETELLKNRLAAVGVTNTEVIPNFKRLVPLSEEELSCSLRPLRLCTFSRVMPEKGTELAVEAVKKLNSMGKKCTLEIFGDPDPGYTERFAELMRSAGEGIEYRGSVPYSKSVEAISRCDALLFPTYWESEGFPGTIVDAFCAGLPVLASDHGANGEIVSDGATGLLYEKNSSEALTGAIDRVYGMSAEELLRMKKNCLEEARRYMPGEYVIKMTEEILNGSKGNKR